MKNLEGNRWVGIVALVALASSAGLEAQSTADRVDPRAVAVSGGERERAAESATAATAQPAEDAAVLAKRREEKLLLERRQAMQAIEAARLRKLAAAGVVETPKPKRLFVPTSGTTQLAVLAQACPTCKVDVLRGDAALAGALAAAAAEGAESPSGFVVTVPHESYELAAELSLACRDCVSLDRGPGGGMVLYSMVDPGGWTPGGGPAPADPCSLPPDLTLALSALDVQIRDRLSRTPPLFDLTVEQYRQAAPSTCTRDLFFYRLSIALQLLAAGAP